MNTRQEANGEDGRPSVLGPYSLPDGWTMVRIAEVGSVQLGRQRSPKDHQGTHMRPYLRVANVFEDRIDTSDVMEMNFTPSEFATYRLDRGNILLNEGQSLELVGRPAMYRDEVPGSCFQNTLVRFKAGPAVRPAFALLIFRHYLHGGIFQRIATRTVNIAHLSAGRFSDLDFPLPPPAEQDRIVALADTLFTRLDAGVSALKSAKVRLRRYRAAVLKAACEGRLVANEAELARAEGRDYESADRLLERIADDQANGWKLTHPDAAGNPRESRRVLGGKTQANGGYDPSQLSSLPDGWTCVQIWQAGEVRLGRQRSPKHHQGTHMRPYLRVANVFEGRIETRDVLEMNFTPEEFEIYQLKYGDILLNRSSRGVQWESP